MAYVLLATFLALDGIDNVVTFAVNFALAREGFSGFCTVYLSGFVNFGAISAVAFAVAPPGSTSVTRDAMFGYLAVCVAGNLAETSVSLRLRFLRLP